MKNINKLIIVLLSFIFFTGACTEFEEKPFSILSGEIVFQNAESYESFMAKLYAGLSVTGQQGPAGDGDIKGIDEGFSNYLRQYWKAQELTTDEAVIAWGDAGLPAYHEHSWTSANPFIFGLYSRIYYQIAQCNEFLRETTTSKVRDRGQSDLEPVIAEYRAEARFLRALSYFHALDIFGNVPFVTEDSGDGATLPSQISRTDLFNYVESELLEIETLLAAPRSNDYGRADQAAAWMLLSKLYLNAETYNGQNKYADCLTYCNKVIGAGYEIEDNYEHNFLADNNLSKEMIFPVVCDGERIQSWGAMTFVIHAAVGGSMVPADYGVDGGWFGSRTTSALVNLFDDETGETDSRAMFYTEGQNKEISSITSFTDGYAIEKFKNITRGGDPGPNLTHPDTDFPMFRLADAYLMYAEAHLRGGGGDAGTAVGYINELRTRAYGDESGNISSGEMDLPFILDERARELYWEGHRRTDLIRYNQFSENGVWPWKGDMEEGVPTDSFRDLFPIPSSDLAANPSLEQNEGY